MTGAEENVNTQDTEAELESAPSADVTKSVELTEDELAAASGAGGFDIHISI